MFQKEIFVFETSTSHEYIMIETVLVATVVRTEASTSYDMSWQRQSWLLQLLEQKLLVVLSVSWQRESWPLHQLEQKMNASLFAFPKVSFKSQMKMPLVSWPDFFATCVASSCWRIVCPFWSNGLSQSEDVTIPCF